jgi:deoxycytidylate deaminase
MDLINTLAVGSAGVSGTRMAACIVFKNKVAAFGVNKLKSHPFQLRFGKNCDSIYLHAEIDAIKNSLRFLEVDDLKKSALYICRIKKEKKKDCWGLSKPCLGCARAIATFNIRTVFYSTDSQTYERLVGV